MPDIRVGFQGAEGRGPWVLLAATIRRKSRLQGREMTSFLRNYKYVPFSSETDPLPNSCPLSKCVFVLRGMGNRPIRCCIGPF